MSLYENDNAYLGTTLRNLIKQPNRISKYNDSFYLRMFQGVEQQALRNNFTASEKATGYDEMTQSQNLMSGIAPRMLSILVKKIASRIFIEGTDKPTPEVTDGNYQGINVIRQYESYLTMKIKECFANSLKTGLNAFVLNFINGKPVINCYSAFRVKLRYNIYDEVEAADIFICNESKEAFKSDVIVQQRYSRTGSDGIKRYYQKNLLSKCQWDREDNLKTTISIVEDIDKDTMKHYAAYQLNKEIELEGFESIGVYVINNTAYNSKFPYVKMPESQFIDCIDMLTELDVSRTGKEIDKYIGRGRVILPKGFNQGAKVIGGNTANMLPAQTFGTAFDKSFFTPYQGSNVNPMAGANQPQPIQFNLRTMEWRAELDGLICDICANIGLSVMDYDPRLINSGNRTDDEINAMTDITYATVIDKRELAEKPINEMIMQIAKLLGLNGTYSIKWSMASVMNPTKNTALVTQQLQNGVISLETAIKRLNPDDNPNEITEELERINNEEKAKVVNTTFNNF